MRLPAALLALIVPLAAAPAAASASTAAVRDSSLVITGHGGDRDSLRVRLDAGGTAIRVTDTRAPVRAGARCTASGRSVTCPAAGLTELVARLGRGGDRIAVQRGVTLRGRLRGGTGDDTLAGGGGPDIFEGGSGRDVVSYASRSDPVVVTSGAGADDGAPGEHDDVLADVEVVAGTHAADVLSGGAARDILHGGGGDDLVDGGPGSDRLTGDRGFDALAGGDGSDVFVASAGGDDGDVMQGGPGADRADYGRRAGGVVADPDGRADDGHRSGGVLSATGPVPAIALLSSGEGDNVLPDVESLSGGRGDDVLAAGAAGGAIEGLAGTDVLSGGPGADRLAGGAGFDRLLARDGRTDVLLCGPQVDRVFIDGLDLPRGDCELASRSIAIRAVALRRALDRGVLPVRVTCPAQAATRCVGAVRLVTVRRLRSSGGRLRTVRLGAARFSAPAGLAVDLDVRVGKAGRAALRRLGGRTRVRVVARGRDEAGPARPSATRLVLRG